MSETATRQRRLARTMVLGERQYDAGHPVMVLGVSREKCQIEIDGRDFIVKQGDLIGGYTLKSDATSSTRAATCAECGYAEGMHRQAKLKLPCTGFKPAASNTTAATPRPWRLSAARTAIVGDDDTKVADCNIGWHKDAPTANANAALIVQAVNSFDALVVALKAIKAGFKDGSIRFTKKRQADSDPYHPANTLMCEALALAEGKDAQ